MCSVPALTARLTSVPASDASSRAGSPSEPETVCTAYQPVGLVGSSSLSLSVSTATARTGA